MCHDNFCTFLLVCWLLTGEIKISVTVDGFNGCYSVETAANCVSSHVISNRKRNQFTRTPFFCRCCCCLHLTLSSNSQKLSFYWRVIFFKLHPYTSCSWVNALFITRFWDWVAWEIHFKKKTDLQKQKMETHISTNNSGKRVEAPVSQRAPIGPLWPHLTMLTTIKNTINFMHRKIGIAFFFNYAKLQNHKKSVASVNTFIQNLWGLLFSPILY